MLACLGDQVFEVFQRPELGMDRGVAPFGGPDGPGAAGIAPAADFGLLFGPLRSVTPIGWMGGRYSTSNPIDATYGNSFSTSANVPCFPGSEAAERGNISYQVEKRARSRSTLNLERASPS